MKRFLITAVIIMTIYACDKETDAVYDTHLFQQLQAQSWVFDYATVTDSLNRDTTIYATDTATQITNFNSQLYTVKNVRVADSMLLDTIAYPIIYDNPSRIYFYDVVTQQVIPKQNLVIDTVNAISLILTKTDSLKTISRSYYHAQ